MGDDEGGLALHELIEGAGEGELGAKVDVASRFIEEDDLRLHKHDAGYAEKLLLAHGHAGGVGDDGIVAFGHAADEFIGVCLLRGCNDFLHAGFGFAEGDVLGNGPSF